MAMGHHDAETPGHATGGSGPGSLHADAHAPTDAPHSHHDGSSGNPTAHPASPAAPGVGGLVSRYSIPGELESAYGRPTSLMLFAKIKID